MIIPERFFTRTLHLHPLGPAITRILYSSIMAVEPEESVNRAVYLLDKKLYVANLVYDLPQYNRVFVLSFGKASIPMASSLEKKLGGLISQQLIITKYLYSEEPGCKNIFVGGHPVPDESSLVAGREALNFLKKISQDDLLICLISGGGSSLLCCPVTGVSLSDIQALTRVLLGCGASINEINALRRKVDILKGGGFIRTMAPAQVLSLILSDVVGNTLLDITSGPTVFDPTTPIEIKVILNRFDLLDKLPASILSVLEKEELVNRPDKKLFLRAQNMIVGSNIIAVNAALLQAKKEGFFPYLLSVCITGEASEVSTDLCRTLRSFIREGKLAIRPVCIIAGGETTVTVKGNGRGGRNQEFALAAASELSDMQGITVVALATDGEDGPTDAAGAVVDCDTYKRAREMAFDPGAFLASNDSYSFFEQLDDLIKVGPTGTNVNDLILLILI